jgi:hypothetical protein
LSLRLPQPGEVHGGAQFQRFCLLTAGNIQSSLQPDFRFLLLRPRLPQEQDAPEAIDFL